MDFRVGLGHDTHRLEVGRQLVIGGIKIPHELGPIAHSDGDVLLHALTDAILGALALGDIGEWFPDTSSEHAGADSSELLSIVMQRVQSDGWQVINADCVVFAQRPKLSSYKPSISQRISELLNVDVNQVNVKAKTGENVGPIGQEEAISAEVVVLLCRT